MQSAVSCADIGRLSMNCKNLMAVVLQSVLVSSLPLPTLLSSPNISLYAGVSNIPPVYNGSGGGWPPPPPRSHTVKYLGIYKTLSECQAACVAYKNTNVSPVSGWTKCESFTYQNQHCTIMLDANYWFPSRAATNATVTGRVTWPPATCKVCTHGKFEF